MRPALFLLFTVASLLNVNDLRAQVPDVGMVYLSGKVVNESRKGMAAAIYDYKNGNRIEEFFTSGIEKFEFSYPLQDSVAFVVYSEGYVSKTVFIDTHVPLNKQKSDYNFPFFIDLYPAGNKPSSIDLKRPVGKIVFSGTQFIYDIDFTKHQNERLKEFVRERERI
jgi:hypothetical protein